MAIKNVLNGTYTKRFLVYFHYDLEIYDVCFVENYLLTMKMYTNSVKLAIKRVVKRIYLETQLWLRQHKELNILELKFHNDTPYPELDCSSRTVLAIPCSL